MDFKWNYSPLTQQQSKEANELAKELNISPILGGLLIKRGITDKEEADHYFNPQISELHDPFSMNDMDVAVDRLDRALSENERIMVYGDYDVDGTTAVALVYNFLKQFTGNLEYYIPDRYEEGYGVSFKGVDTAAQHGVKLVIVLDCGIKAVKQIAYAVEQGIDFIVCDHHVPDDVLPPAVAILNAKRVDSTYPYSHLSGCGVGFKFMQAFAIQNGVPFDKLFSLLDLVAVSTTSDIVPIMGENRVLTYYGMKQLNTNPTTGLKAIIDVCGLTGKQVTINDIIFKIGPRLNAAGRVRTGMDAVELLVEPNYAKAKYLSEEIDRNNEKRKELDKLITCQANHIVDSLGDLSDRHSIVLYNENWNRGVIGIVASRLTEKYCLPTVVLTKSGNMATGSARSVGGFNLYNAISSCKDLLDNFGGHTYAAGLLLDIKNVPEFKDRFEQYVATHIKSEQIEPTIDIDLEVCFDDISPKLFEDLKRFMPFGPDNPKPIFCTKNVYDYGTSKVVGRNGEHIKFELIDNRAKKVMNGIAFGFGKSGQAKLIKTKKSFDICYTIEENTYHTNDVQLQIEAIRAHND